MNKSYLISIISRRLNAHSAPSFLAISVILLFAGFNISSVSASCPDIVIVNELPAGSVGYVILNMDGDTLAFRPYGGPAPACQLTVGETYQIRPFRPHRDMNGVTTFDMIETLRHIVGEKVFTGNFPQQIAADVNRSYTITISDVILTREFILDPGKELDHRLSWEFFREDAAFFPLPPGVLANGVFVYSGPGQVIPYIAIKVGRTRTPEKYFFPGYPMEGTVIFEVEDISLIPGQTYNVPVKAIGFNGMNGFQFALDLNVSALKFMGINKGSLDLLYHGEPIVGLVTTHWIGPELKAISLDESETAFTIQIKANQSGKLSQFMKLDTDAMLAQSYDEEEGFWDIELAFKTKFTGTKGSSLAGESAPSELMNNASFGRGSAAAVTRFDGGHIEPFKLHDAVPNPARERTRIGLTVPEKGEVQWLIRDVQGKAIVEQQQQVGSGFNELIWEASGMTPGMYFLSVRYDGQILTQSLLIE